MKKLTFFSMFLIIVLFCAAQAFSQSLNFEAYKKYFNECKNLDYTGITTQYQTGLYSPQVSLNVTNANYLDSIRQKYNLTNYENELIQKNGFMVTERLSYPTFWGAFTDVYAKDMPIFVSTDAILHAWHKSYDAILKKVERSYIIPKLDTLLSTLYNYRTALVNRYSGDSIMMQSVNDFDVYITIARMLLDSNINNIVLPQNAILVNDILSKIKSEKYQEMPLFSYTSKNIDFSQFTVRGHYTESKELSSYFQAMIWLSRIELYLIAPKPDAGFTMDDIQRQIIDAMLILEAIEKTGSDSFYLQIDDAIKAFVGDQDNVKIEHLRELCDEIGVTSPDYFLDTLKCIVFQDALAQKSYADQKILSQVLFEDPYHIEKIKPASAFLLFGQRFIIDSYITGNVVYDKTEQRRMLPSTLDVLFALGNDAALPLLRPELETYKYYQNLAPMRYLVDANDDSFWNYSIYNNWLQAIRKLNPPDESSRSKYPKFMQTAAWWQEKMNTQLASWTELRHDNLLYGKQSYTGGVTCSYPDGYVEPYPEFFQTMSDLAINAKQRLNNFPIYLMTPKFTDLYGYFDNFSNVMDTLKNIAQKELTNTPLTESEKGFILRLRYTSRLGCDASAPDGWFVDLYIDRNIGESDMSNNSMNRYVVADIHTAPTDAGGALVGWVKHVGTGPVNMAVITVEDPTDGCINSYIGPVMSYYEHTTLNFKRLTDEEWEKSYDSIGMRPDLVNLYLANKQGIQHNGEIVSLPTSMTGVPIDPLKPQLLSYPNPFSESSLINLYIPQTSTGNVIVNVFDEQGILIKSLFDGSLQSGWYLLRWDANDNFNKKVSAGVYFYRINIHGDEYTVKTIKTD